MAADLLAHAWPFAKDGDSVECHLGTVSSARMMIFRISALNMVAVASLDVEHAAGWMSDGEISAAVVDSVAGSSGEEVETSEWTLGIVPE